MDEGGRGETGKEREEKEEGGSSGQSGEVNEEGGGSRSIPLMCYGIQHYYIKCFDARI